MSFRRILAFVLLFPPFLATSLWADNDCNSLPPVWKLKDTECVISPYYYEAKIESGYSVSCSCGEDYHNYSLSGDSTEYITGHRCVYGDNLPDIVYYYSCKEPSYSCDGSTQECFIGGHDGCGDTHPRYGCFSGLCLDCDSDPDCESSGSWSGKTFTGSYGWDSDFDHDGDSGTSTYSRSIKYEAIFEVIAASLE